MNRAKEPSTYAGIAAIFQALKTFLPQYAMYLDMATVVTGSVAAMVTEQKQSGK